VIYGPHTRARSIRWKQRAGALSSNNSDRHQNVDG